MRTAAVCALLVATLMATLHADDIHEAARAGDSDRAAAVLRKNPGAARAVDASGWTALHYAARAGDAATLRLLLKAGATVDAKQLGWTPLHEAVGANRPAAAAILLEAKAPADAAEKSGRTPLHWSIMLGHQDTTALLIARKAPVNQPDSDSRTPLHYAALHGRHGAAERLLKAGADVVQRDKEGNLPANLAAEAGFIGMAGKLFTLAAKQDIFAAARTGDVKSIEKLLQHKPRLITARRRQQQTPLHVAANHGQKEAARLLLKHGADRGAKDAKGRTPADVATQAGHLEVAMICKGGDLTDQQPLLKDE